MMKKILCLLTLAILTVLTLFSCAGQVGNSNGINNFNIKRGTNLSHWLSQSRIVGEERRNHIQEDDFERLEQLGFDFVRILLMRYSSGMRMVKSCPRHGIC